MANSLPQVASAIPVACIVETTISDLLALAGDYRQYNRGLLSYFAPDIRSIVKGALDDPECEEECELLIIARQCYWHATAPDGVLNCHHYFSPLSGSTPEPPSVPKIQPAEHQGNGSLLTAHPPPVAGRHSIDNRKTEDWRRTEQMWIVLWTEVLRNSPGPILFDPLASPLFSTFDFHLDAIPRYLFRTFDPKSFGRSNEEVVASPASESRTVSSRSDILSQDGEFAMSVVDRHMNPWRVKDYERQKPDNLMSWTSSFLYAIQYALYRRHHHGCNSEDIKICVVDTERFPRGQFIHAKRLLQAYYSLVKRADLLQSFDLRLLVYIYQNGEYLSQGALNHKGRSRVISLAQLEESGLYSLYPEFADGSRHAKWAVTTSYLRHRWRSPHVSTYEELERALLLASRCFAGFRALDIAVIFLCFKERVLKRRLPGESQLPGELVPEWARKPQEVQQYIVALQMLQSLPQMAIEKPGDGADENMMQALRGCFKVRSYEDED